MRIKIVLSSRVKDLGYRPNQSCLQSRSTRLASYVALITYTMTKLKTRCSVWHVFQGLLSKGTDDTSGKEEEPIPRIWTNQLEGCCWKKENKKSQQYALPKSFSVLPEVYLGPTYENMLPLLSTIVRNKVSKKTVLKAKGGTSIFYQLVYITLCTATFTFRL